ncbi:hypothetical protein RJ639_020292 [Escallonia herrerae]|uniref:Chromo domain-containing protein n=1 Tax=Escallonia herrerae TaxID=1293975 RepID=A0AA88V386_9ASTE|nr:hypothetical protein RJ639_020292 [Escallonia herrerae]
MNDRVITASPKRHQEYLVKWQGYIEEENTWERAADLSAYKDKIEAYHLQKLTRASTALVGENVIGCPLAPNMTSTAPLHPSSTVPMRLPSTAPLRPSSTAPMCPPNIALASSSSLAHMHPLSTAAACPCKPCAVSSAEQYFGAAIKLAYLLNRSPTTRIVPKSSTFDKPVMKSSDTLSMVSWGLATVAIILLSFYAPPCPVDKMASFGIDDFAEKYGLLNPSQFVDVMSLMGDKADNIPGTLENLLEHVDQVEEERIKKSKFVMIAHNPALISNAEQAILSKNLIIQFSD